MTYLNRFLIEDETEYKCYGVYKGYSTDFHLKRIMNNILNMRSKKSESKILHVLESAEFEADLVLHSMSSNFNSRINLMLTRFGSERIECVQKMSTNNSIKKDMAEKKTVWIELSFIFSYPVRKRW